MIYSDSHCHLDSYPPEKLETVLNRMKEEQVEFVVSVSMTPETCEEAVDLARTYENVYAAVGIHPGLAKPLSSKEKRRLEELCDQPGVVALGEIGIEYSGPDGRPMSNIEVQKEIFNYELSLAGNARLPIDIHYSMDAQEDIIKIIRQEKHSGLTGIAHAFQGSLTDLHEWLDIGFYISIGAESLGLRRSIKDAPPLTSEVVRAVPSDRLLTETDSMYRGNGSGKQHAAPLEMANNRSKPPPEDHNVFLQPADVVKVAEKIGEMRDVPVWETGRTATENLKRILKI